jgi:hypothetical protein
LIQNDSNFPLEISEEGNNLWTLVPAENVVGFWPVKSAKQRMMARFPNTAEESVPFPYGVQFEGFAKIENEVSVIILKIPILIP